MKHDFLIDEWVEDGATNPLILYTQTSVCIFSIVFSIHFPSYLQGEFVEQSKASLLDDHFLYSCNLNM